MLIRYNLPSKKIESFMPLPLDDSRNPLHGESIDTQISCIIKWKQHFKNARKLFSLDKDYSKTAVQKAYRQLALRFHPDKNRGILFAEKAFKIIMAAREYLEYLLLPRIEQHESARTMQNNPFWAGSTDWGNGFGFMPKRKTDYNDARLYEGKALHEVLEVLQKSCGTWTKKNGAKPFILPEAAKAHIQALMKAGSVSKPIDIVAWMTLCRNPDDLEFFRSFCDYSLGQSYNFSLQAIQQYPKMAGRVQLYEDDAYQHLLALLNIKEAQFVMQQLFRFIDGSTQEKVIALFKEVAFSPINSCYLYQTVAIFLGWHSSSDELAKEIRAHIINNYHYSKGWEVIYFTEMSPLKPKATAMARRALCKHLAEYNLLTPMEELYSVSKSKDLDYMIELLDKHKELSPNPYCILSRILYGNIFRPLESNEEHWSSYHYEKHQNIMEEILLPEGVEHTAENIQQYIKKLITMVFKRSAMDSDAIGRLFLDHIDHFSFSDEYTLLFVLDLAEEFGVASAVKETILEKALRRAIVSVERISFRIYANCSKKLSLIKDIYQRDREHLYQWPWLQEYLLKKYPHPQVVQTLVDIEPRFARQKYKQIPQMGCFSHHDFLGYNEGYSSHITPPKYYPGTCDAHLLHARLYYCSGSNIEKEDTAACAVIKAMQAGDYALFNKEISIPIHTNPKRWDILQLFYNEPEVRYTCCNALHMAAVQGRDMELLEMLKRGGDYNKKAQIWCKGWFLGINTLSLEEKSVFEYAKAQKLTSSCAFILEQELQQYIDSRAKEANYINGLSCFGIRFWNFGYNRLDKINGAKALLREMQGLSKDLQRSRSCDIDEINTIFQRLRSQHPAITQGRLGQLFSIMQQFPAWQLDEYETSNGLYSMHNCRKDYSALRGFAPHRRVSGGLKPNF